ncbi:MAG: hypothetical protein V4693_00010 [Pseudomonadota bacterium]
MSKNAAFDASIPVLTEVFQAPSVEEEAPVAAETPRQGHDIAEAVVEPLIENAREPQWGDIEHRLSERIRAQIHDNIDAELMPRVRERLEAAMQQALAEISDEIRGSLRHNVDEIVAQAVGEELARLQSPSN